MSPQSLKLGYVALGRVLSRAELVTAQAAHCHTQSQEVSQTTGYILLFFLNFNPTSPYNHIFSGISNKNQRNETTRKVQRTSHQVQILSNNSVKRLFIFKSVKCILLVPCHLSTRSGPPPNCNLCPRHVVSPRHCSPWRTRPYRNLSHT